MYEIDRVIKHNYIPDAYENDLTLLKTHKEVTFSERVWPIAISTKWIEPKRVGVLPGFGYTSFSLFKDKAPERTEFLRFVNLPVISNEKCLKKLKKGSDKLSLQSTGICTYAKRGSENFGNSPNEGDSGGPLVIDNQLVGIISWAKLFSGISAFMRLSEYTQWIEEQTGIKAD